MKSFENLSIDDTQELLHNRFINIVNESGLPLWYSVLYDQLGEEINRDRGLNENEAPNHIKQDIQNRSNSK